ncbi:hypothetical protein BDF14DRAFT_1992496 [Spinellus fusiger]|nr:hypothetical protein BDF14DRAFT_1992496 [Spinellus fusiger]
MSFSEEPIVYLNDYTGTTEVLPLELQRSFTLIRQLDESAEDLMEKVATESFRIAGIQTVLSSKERQEQLVGIGELLNQVLKKGEEKFALTKSIYDTVDRHCTRLDNDLSKFENAKYSGTTLVFDPVNMSRAHTEDKDMGNGKAHVQEKAVAKPEKKSNRGKKRKNIVHEKEKQEEPQEEPQGDYLSTEDAKHHAEAAISLSQLPIDPNEPLYCYCQQVSFGEMVACDNEECDIEWFHIECVGLKVPPKGKWYCKNCGIDTKEKQRRLL